MRAVGAWTQAALLDDQAGAERLASDLEAFAGEQLADELLRIQAGDMEDAPTAARLVWSCSEVCTCPDSNAHTADPCMSTSINCQFPITGTGDDAPYACMCQQSNGYAMRWICRDKASQQPLCPEIPANWNCIDLGLSSCLTPNGSCNCDPEGVFVCTP